MNPRFVAPLALLLLASFCVSNPLPAASAQVIPEANVALWRSTSAEHVYGFPDMKPHTKGTLTLSADALTFAGKPGNISIPRSSLTAVSAGDQRVELWGVKGRILRAVIPEGGGLVAATFMHHRVDLLTVEFSDVRGGSHGAVFLLPANEAALALQSFVQTPISPRKPSEASCRNAPIEPKSVLVSAPDWDQAAVPAAYRALVYEHVIDRLQHAKDAGHVYRDGEGNGHAACPQYIVHISIAAFKQGSQVQRAFLGPAGMFVGTTQMTFETTLTDASGKLNLQEQVKATMRGESESTDVTDKVAKTLAKHYAAAVKSNKSGAPVADGAPAS